MDRGEHSLEINPRYASSASWKAKKNSEAKDHFVTLERKLELWKNGNTIELLNKGESIQERLPTSERSKDTEKSMLSQCK